MIPSTKIEPGKTHAFWQLKFTTTLAVTLMGFAVWSDSHGDELSHAWRNGLGFSALNLADLQWHQTLTSLVLTSGERQFVQSLLMLCISVGLCEWRFGSWTAIKVFFASHLIVTVGLALFVVLPLHYAGMEWATALASERDVGPSAGYYGCLGVAIMSVRYPLRLAVVFLMLVVLIAHLMLSLEFLHTDAAMVSANVAHLAAFPLGMLLAQLGFAGQLAARPPSLTSAK